MQLPAIFDKAKKPRRNHGLSRDDRAPAIAVIVFAMCIAGITFAGNNLTYLFFDTTKNLAAFWLAFFFAPYTHIRIKSALFGILINEVIAVAYAVSVIAGADLIPYEIGWIFALIISVLYAGALIRLQFTRKIESREPDLIEDYVYLVPIHTWKGLAQCLFLPWHNGRYESRVVCAGDKIYLLHRGKFKRVDALRVDVPENAVKIPLGRRLKETERQRLDRLVGTSSFFLIRDCRKLTGAIEDF